MDIERIDLRNLQIEIMAPQRRSTLYQGGVIRADDDPFEQP